MPQREVLLETGTNELEIIEFYVRDMGGGEPFNHYFGVNVAKVLEVVEAPDGLSGSRASDPSFLGTIPLRELVLPVIDLSVWLGIERDREPNEPIIVTEFNNTITGFLVSGVTQIHRINWRDVEPPSKMMANMPSNCINGTVEIEDRFVLMLDLERVLSDLEHAHHEIGEGETPDATGYRALVADDSTSVRKMLETRFTEAGYDVELASDGMDAWRKLQALKTYAQEAGVEVTELLDVVVSDIEMPQLDGYTLTRMVKEDRVLNVLPVALFSSLISDSLIYRGEAVNADLQVTKPDFNKLVAKVTDLLSRRRTGSV